MTGTCGPGFWPVTLLLLVCGLQLSVQNAITVVDTNDIDQECGEAEVLVDDLCLPKQPLTKGCWVTNQCSSMGSVCRRPSGRILYSMHYDLWQSFLRSNRSQNLVPGRCGCDEDFVMHRTSEGQMVCQKRAIGSPCISNYECGKRTRFSLCYMKKCICLFPGYEYESATDRCIPAANGIACEKGSCPHAWFPGTIAELCFYGFSGSMALVLGLWLTFSFCQAPGLDSGQATDRYLYQAIPTLNPPPSDDPDNLFLDDEPPPPPYDTVIVRKKEKKFRTGRLKVKSNGAMEADP